MTVRSRPSPAQWFGVRRGPRSAAPAVMFFDHAGYEQFDQIACCLHRRGIAAIRAVPSRSGQDGRSFHSLTRWLRDQLFYERRLRLDSAGQVASLETGALRGFRLLDTLLSEATVARMGLDDPMIEALARRSLAFAEHPARALLDKFEVNARLAAAGVPVPAQCPANALSPPQAVQAFGLPLVVKARVGLGGDGVRIARSLAEVERALQDLCHGDLGGGFFQSYVEGKAVGYACVRGADGPLLDFGYRVDATQWPLGPSAKVAVDGDASLEAVGRRVVEALACRGFAQIDMIRDAAGQVWPIDANLRPSGNILSFLCLNLDFAEAYASLLLGPARRPAQPAAPPGPDAADVFPFALYDAARNGSPARLSAVLGQFQLICRRGPGWRYRLVVTVKLLGLLLRRRRPRAEAGLLRTELSH